MAEIIRFRSRRQREVYSKWWRLKQQVAADRESQREELAREQRRLDAIDDDSTCLRKEDV